MTSEYENALPARERVPFSACSKLRR